MDEQQGTFKVTDRRLFNADGSPRELTPEEKTEAEAQPEVSPTEAAAPEQVVDTTETATAESEPAPDELATEEDQEEFDESDIPGAHDPSSFVNFAMSIASNAASALGMMEHPVTHKREVDLELGKHWIDVLGMLQQKTAGNLSTGETKILEGWLADLRMQFVSLSSSAAAKGPQPYTGKDIIGGK
ncbi:MAG TPA: DUF1844 domain-containing protein [Pyrinomonadaceae bacterium]|nr:DUF1844 domain-containing protein [Pyrinomonadaceae bacterium]